MTAISSEPPVPDDRVVVRNLLLTNETVPGGGLTINVSLRPRQEYVVELRGECILRQPFLIIDTGGPSPIGRRYVMNLVRGLRFRVNTEGTLRLLIYQDAQFAYAIAALRVRRADRLEDQKIPAIFDPTISLDKYSFP